MTETTEAAIRRERFDHLLARAGTTRTDLADALGDDEYAIYASVLDGQREADPCEATFLAALLGVGVREVLNGPVPRAAIVCTDNDCVEHDR